MKYFATLLFYAHIFCKFIIVQRCSIPTACVHTEWKCILYIILICASAFKFETKRSMKTFEFHVSGFYRWCAWISKWVDNFNEIIIRIAVCVCVCVYNSAVALTICCIYIYIVSRKYVFYILYIHFPIVDICVYISDRRRTSPPIWLPRPSCSFPFRLLFYTKCSMQIWNTVVTSHAE